MHLTFMCVHLKHLMLFPILQWLLTTQPFSVDNEKMPCTTKAFISIHCGLRASSNTGFSNLLLTAHRLKVSNDSVRHFSTIYAFLYKGQYTLCVNHNKIDGKTYSFCIPLEVALHPRCGTRAVGCRPLTSNTCVVLRLWTFVFFD